MKGNTRMKRLLAVLSISTVVLATLSPLRAIGAEVSTQETPKNSNRLDHRIGFSLGILDPNPGLLGLNAHYNINDYLRASAGWANLETTSSISVDGNTTTSQKSRADTFGVGLTGAVPGWNLTPTLGLHYARIFYSGTPGLEVGGFKESGGHVYTSIGVNYQSPSGFDVEVGYNLSLASNVGGSAFAHLGWFFDWI
jgi:hypothetical protein